MEKLNQIFQKHINEGKYPGVQWKINFNNKNYEGKVGYKNLETEEIIEEDTIYRIWSMTKPIVAVAAMQLIENEQMSLDDPINKYLPEFSNLKVLKDEENISITTFLKNPPTIKDLFLHTAGFSYNFLNDSIGKEYEKIKLFQSSTSSLEEEILLLSKVPLLFQPSTKWRYSVSMDVLARILEVVLQEPLQVILEKQIFSPLYMKDTSFFINKNNTHRLMKSYEFDYVENKLTEIIADPQKIGTYGYPISNNQYARGGHGLYSTTVDYMSFANMLHSGKSKDGKKIIDKKTINFMTKNLLSPSFFPIEILSIGTIKDKDYVNDLDAYGWGLGFRTLVDRSKNSNLGSIGEFGWSGAAATYFLVDPVKNISAVLMTQVLNADSNLKKDFYRFIYTNL
tara:strand:+ start:6106 stop:7293 length:1188 start_codon:yes stop_codon:yes gene_type:complete